LLKQITSFLLNSIVLASRIELLFLWHICCALLQQVNLKRSQRIVPDFVDRQWYVVYCKPQKERYAQFHLESKQLQVFFPRLLLPEGSKSRKRIVPLFPNYLFVNLHILSEECFYVTWSPGVKRIVSFNGCPAPIDAQIITFFIQQADQEGIIPARTNLKAGQEVRITGGPLDGLIGILQEPPNASGRVKILLKLLNRETRVEVPIQFIKSGWVASAPSVEI
jgi:transcription elongation factor/antiterminator RfaH